MAEIGPIGSVIYANQQMAGVASEKSALLNRFELQALAAAALSQEKEREVVTIRPMEESHSVDPDREHAKEGSEQEQRRPSHHEEKPPVKKVKSFHLLDIKV
ncbi:MAG: hypothetical protein M0P91_01735 [Sulfuricurvum sp.]|jgi:hypothetical protein|uniref:hypothetical protein n=1 Tax=Sulfuricurvum sp. TaxID=2025608 RepID=UPI0025DA6724|nr:hypothetical protein [Sulfuricurvum sp.]MCK9371891.1 hypothetical protein [Sulfuricurvum sp.]